MRNHLSNPIAYAAIATALLVTAAPLLASDADEAVELAFRKSYVSKTFLKDDSIKVKAEDGVVTLTGTVADEYNKGLALETAAGLIGVTRVDNLLETKAQVDAENADTWIARKVRLALRFHHYVSGGDTTVVVKDGVVTLTGVASSAAQKDLTAEYAADIEGVQSVVNNMTVADAPVPAVRTVGEKIDDASVAAQVKFALKTHRSTSAVSTKVTARDGEVTLTGIAQNEAEKALVTKLVSSIEGVTEVKNEMTIAVAQ